MVSTVICLEKQEPSHCQWNKKVIVIPDQNYRINKTALWLPQDSTYQSTTRHVTNNTNKTSFHLFPFQTFLRNKAQFTNLMKKKYPFKKPMFLVYSKKSYTFYGNQMLIITFHLFLILVKINPLHITVRYFFKLHFNNISHLHSGPPSCHFSFTLSYQKAVHFSSAPYVLHAPSIISPLF